MEGKRPRVEDVGEIEIDLREGQRPQLVSTRLFSPRVSERWASAGQDVERWENAFLDWGEANEVWVSGAEQFNVERITKRSEAMELLQVLRPIAFGPCPLSKGGRLPPLCSRSAVLVMQQVLLPSQQCLLFSQMCCFRGSCSLRLAWSPLLRPT